MNLNKAIKVHLYCSFRLIVANWRILLGSCTEGCHRIIGIRIADNTIEEESMTESSIRI